MDVSLNNINNINKNELSFEGVRGTYNVDNVPVFRFTPPPHDLVNEVVTLEFVPLKYDSETNEMVPPKKSQIKSKVFSDAEPIAINQKHIVDGYKGFAYRYKIENKSDNSIRYFVDDFSKINIQGSIPGDKNSQMNVIRLWGSYMVDPKSGAMTHRYVDSDSILLPDGKTFAQGFDMPPRTAFNRMGGTTKGLLERIKAKEFSPYRYVMTNPDIGKDSISSHKYWPENLFQCSDVQVFKDINFELFQQGKGYVADGAFTSQSLQSPLFQHVLKWGKNSPYFNMFKIDTPNSPLSLGVLPQNMSENDNDSFEHTAVKLVNSPYQEGYDRTKPIYLQLYDDRLVSEENIKSNKLIPYYDKSPDDVYEITNNEDAVNPYRFEIFTDAEEYDFKEKIKVFKNSNHISLKDLDKKVGSEKFFDFGNYKLVRRDAPGNATFWDGNIDMVKFNLSNSKDREGMKNARNYIWNVATYWTEMVQSDLIKRTAQMAKNPIALVEIMSKSGVKDPLSVLKTPTDKREYPVLQEDKKVEDYIKTFPLQSLQASPELSPILASPGFNELLFDEATMKTLSQLVNSVIDYSMPQLEKGKDYRTYVTKTYANEIINYFLSEALNPNCVKDGKVDLDELNKVTLKSIIRTPESFEEERTAVIKAIRKGLKEAEPEATQRIKARISEELQDITLQNFKEAETTVLQSKGGLNWRFDAAKDIGDMDAVRAGIKDFKDVWDGVDGVEGVWLQFIKNVKKYAPSSYIIAEVTDLPGFYSWSGDAKINFAFDKNFHMPDIKEDDFLLKIGATTKSEYNNLFNKLSCFAGTNPENYNDTGNDTLERAGNLDALKGSVQNFINNFRPNNAISAHVYFENHDKPKVLHTLPINSEIFHLGESLIRTNGEYKQIGDFANDVRAMNLEEYINSFGKTKRNEYKEKISKLTGRSDFALMSPKAVAVGLKMRELLENLPEVSNSDYKYGYTQEQKQRMLNALTELVNGRKAGLPANNVKRAKAFGVQAYEISFKEILKRAQIDDNVQERVRDLRYNFLKPYINMETRMWEMVNAIVGTPTMFNGMEYAQTGYESKSKNQEIKNRNAILHEDIADPRFKAIYNKYMADTGLYLQHPELDAIREGFPVVCEVNHTVEPMGFDFLGDVDAANNEGNLDYIARKVESHGGFNDLKELMEEGISDEDILKKYKLYPDNVRDLKTWFYKGDYKHYNYIEQYINYKKETAQSIDLLPIVKYKDKDSLVLTVITNNGVPRAQLSYQLNEDNFDPNFEVDSIDLKVKANVEDENGMLKETVQSPLPEGTPLRKMIYRVGADGKGKYIKSSETFIVKDGKVVDTEGKKIKLEDSCVTFYKPSESELRRECIAKYPSGYKMVG